MHKPQGLGMEAQAVGRRCLGSVAVVTRNRMAAVLHVDADLILTPGGEAELYQ